MARVSLPSGRLEDRPFSKNPPRILQTRLLRAGSSGTREASRVGEVLDVEDQSEEGYARRVNLHSTYASELVEVLDLGGAQ